MQDQGALYFWAGPRADARARHNAYCREWCRRNWPQCLGVACLVFALVTVAYVTTALLRGVTP